MKINRIEQYSPWEESFNNLIQFCAAESTLNPLKSSHRQYIHCKEPKDYLPLNKTLKRNQFNISKINMHNFETIEKKTNENLKIAPKKYEGPRISFYSKMNPKGNQKSLQKLAKQKLQGTRRAQHLRSLTLSLLDQQNRLTKSKKMLQIYDQVEQRLQRKKSNYFYLDKILNYISRQDQETDRYISRRNKKDVQSERTNQIFKERRSLG